MMFDQSPKPRVFSVPPGADFPKALVNGLRDRLTGKPPHAIAQVDLIVNTRRMARRLRKIFDQGPPGFLPKIHLLSGVEALTPEIDLPPAVPALRHRLELIQLVSKLIDADTALAPRSSLYALADSLSALIDEMQGEGVSADVVKALDVSDQSGHWERAQRFVEIAHQFMGNTPENLGQEARQRVFVTRLTQLWQENPPNHPILLAGSTGSRGTTSMLMQCIARLPQGGVILPGFDDEMTSANWLELEHRDAPAEDHPQYRFRQLMQSLDLPSSDIKPWFQSDVPSRARNRLVSLSLRPAPVTHAWLTEGPKLAGVAQACAGITLVEAPSPRAEALAIAMRLRKAAATGQTAALITPDRMLSRQVTAALDRWNILPDDSAGTPLQLSPPGRFLRHVASLLHRQLDAEALLTLLKHPLTHSGGGRNFHQLHTQRLEAQIRRHGLPFPDPDGIIRMAERAAVDLTDPQGLLQWAKWVAATFCSLRDPSEKPLSAWIKDLTLAAEKIATGHIETDPSELWRRKAGQEAQRIIENLTSEAEYGGSMSASDFADLIGALLATGEVRDRDAPHANIMVWGTLEARVQGADLVILGGLNDGGWPEAPTPDPWLNRQMRLKAGLLLPERRIGLSAHDYQQAIAAPEVWLTRAIRSDDAETVPSRWLNRLGNLLRGLPSGEGKTAWADMQNRGVYWIGQTQALEQPQPISPASRPSPRPPRSARPKKLSVTEIKRLIRDPYAIYAKHGLRLSRINALVQSADAPMRGIVLHQIMEDFVKSTVTSSDNLNKDNLLRIAQTVLDREAPWPAARLMWLARINRIADWFIALEAQRQQNSNPAAFEANGKLEFPDLGISLRGVADRIDLDTDGRARIYDYKTGTPPSKKEQKFFDKQLLLEAAMVEQGAFEKLGARAVAEAQFIGLGTNPTELEAPLADEPPAEVLAGLKTLIAHYLDPAQGFTARRLVQRETDTGDFDQLARFGEWDDTTPASPEDLT